MGDMELKVPSVSPNKIVSTTGEWSVTWNKTVQATIFTFPHRSAELFSYGETIINLFGATHLAGHAVNLNNVLSGYHSTSNNDEHIKTMGDMEFKVPSVIAFDCAVRH